MAEKLKCPHCGKCIGESVTDNADITLQTHKPIKAKKTKVVIEKICQRCKNLMYMIIDQQPTTV